MYMTNLLFVVLAAYYVFTSSNAANVSYLDDAYFRGNRYILDNDIALMLLFDSKGKIAGIQNGVSYLEIKKVGEIRYIKLSSINLMIIMISSVASLTI